MTLCCLLHRTIPNSMIHGSVDSYLLYIIPFNITDNFSEFLYVVEFPAVDKFQLQKFSIPLVSLHETILKSFSYTRSESSTQNRKAFECGECNRIVVRKVSVIIIFALPCQRLDDCTSALIGSNDSLEAEEMTKRMLQDTRRVDVQG